MSDPKGAIRLTGSARRLLMGESAEVARLWVTHEAGSSVFINASVLQEPFAFGILMADTIRHAARAYAAAHGLDEQEALQEIVDGATRELRAQLGEIETIDEGRLS